MLQRYYRNTYIFTFCVLIKSPLVTKSKISIKSIGQ